MVDLRGSRIEGGACKARFLPRRVRSLCVRNNVPRCRCLLRETARSGHAAQTSNLSSFGCVFCVRQEFSCVPHCPCPMLLFCPRSSSFRPSWFLVDRPYMIASVSKRRTTWCSCVSSCARWLALMRREALARLGALCLRSPVCGRAHHLHVTCDVNRGSIPDAVRHAHHQHQRQALAFLHPHRDLTARLFRCFRVASV